MTNVKVQNAKWSRALALIVSLVTLGALFAANVSETNGNLLWFHYNAYAILSLIPLIANVVVLTIMIRRPARTDERMWLAIYLADICIWSLIEAFQRMSVMPETAMFWTTISGATNVFMAGSIYLFALSYTNRSDKRYTGTIVTVIATATLLTFYYCYTQIIFKTTPDAIHLFPWGYNNDPGPGFLAIVLWVDMMYMLGAVRLIGFRRHTSNPILRKQSMLFFIALVFPVVVGTITDALLPALGVTSLPPLAMLSTTVTAVILTYGVVRYKLLTINQALFSETILSIINEAVVVTDDKYTILYTNPKAEMLLGIRGSAGQRSLLPFIGTKNHVQALREAYESQAHKTPDSLEHIDIKSTAGKTTPVRVTNSLLPVENLKAYVMVLVDITAELHSKSIIEQTVQLRTKELHEARAYLLASINSLAQGFILIDKNGKVETTNLAARQLLLDVGAEVDAPTIIEMTTPMRWDVDLGASVESVLQLRKSKQMHAAAENGSFYDLYLTPILAGDEVVGAVLLLEDVTERKITERSRDEFFSIASHELRTPLTAIRGNMSIASDYFPEYMKDPKLADLIHATHSASVRLIEIVNDFLDSSRLEQGKMQFTIVPIEVSPIVASIQKDLAEVLKANHNTMVVEGLDRLPSIQVDANRFKQILYNIIGNASKYGDHATITITGQVKGRKLSLLVADTGKGIAPENQKLLFHKFQQAADSILSRTDTQGTGLGLYISRMLADKMGGGVVLVHSELGVGSTFEISMPLAKKTTTK